MDLLDGLNPEQVNVVEHLDGPLRVGAVAGAGKTKALVHRVARLVERGVNPRRILALTFSKKAADEMNVRLAELIGRDSGARVGTFHSFALEILRADVPCGGVEIDDRDHYRTIVKQVVGFRGMNWTSADVTLIVEYIGRCKAAVELPKSPDAMARARAYYTRKPGPQTTPRLLAEAYERAEVERVNRRLLTFDDMLVEVVRFFDSDDDVRTSWASRYDYVLQDEAQDVNPAQNRIAHAMARDHRNYMVVGDPAQAIYQFRGADPESLVRFSDEWPGTVDVAMSRNYRCGTKIAEAANGILREMAVRLPGLEIQPERAEEGLVDVTAHEDQDEEARAISRTMMELYQDGVRWGEMCVLYRTNAQSRAMEEVMLGERIPHVVLGGTAFYNRREVADLLSYLRAARPGSTWEQVKRSINAPFRYLAAAFLKRCEEEATEADETDWPALVRRVAAGSGIQTRQRASAEEWASLVEWIRDEMDDAGAHADNPRPDDYRGPGETRALPAALLERIVMETKFIAWLTKDEGEESVENSRASNVRELIRAASKFRTVDELLTHVDDTIQRSRTERAKGGDRVTLMTIHKSKGLEYRHVWVISCNEKILPHARAVTEPNGLEEERRLAYVAFTRAKDALRISWVRQAAVGPKLLGLTPSQFIAEAGLEANSPVGTSTDAVVSS